MYQVLLTRHIYPLRPRNHFTSVISMSLQTDVFWSMVTATSTMLGIK